MKEKSSPSFLDLVHLQDSIRRKYYRKAGITKATDVLVALASGLDAALTIIGSSSAEFDGLSREAGRKVSEYFRSESGKYAHTDIETSIWYLSWADAIESVFID